MNNRANAGFLSGRTAILIIILLLLAATIYIVASKKHQSQQTSSPNVNAQTTTTTSLANLELPAIKSNQDIVAHTGFALSYNEEHKEANWVAYKLTASQANSSQFNRTNHFMEDPEVAEGTANDEDYQGSGYDRGHLAPAEDMAWSAKSMQESFYYSNMTPQAPTFNRGVWRRLEELIRFWANYYDSIFIVTGPVLTNDLPTIGRVSVPKYFYKVVLEYNAKEVRAIGFVMPNNASYATLKSFAVSVDSVEKLTGLDFFPKLPDDVENSVESDPAINKWQWTRKKQKSEQSFK
ncbi:DNA/RNA non-specific endonuclease [Chitinophagaceae bacterium LB-8]|uniref:DNA/RNA non-specific endonuclease n=1 Tax=Paraflavisolibacter caeni TaxID=2982496 RepID=A0A9X2XPD4_9BACT|nr:DNA/RNA non-specific endonuclease [Paraflavisolibacter caeni]MCU7551038.1 DNA/RNA non-specific endonuclease [Paraflavisolibacter caeni]